MRIEQPKSGETRSSFISSMPEEDKQKEDIRAEILAIVQSMIDDAMISLRDDITNDILRNLSKDYRGGAGIRIDGDVISSTLAECV